MKYLLCAFLLAFSAFTPALAQDSPAPETVRFTLAPDDLTSWEESGGGKFIQIDMTDEKKMEMERLTAKAQNKGKHLDIAIGEAVIHAGAIDGPMILRNGFVLVPQDDQRAALVGILDPAKQKKPEQAEMAVGAEGAE